MNRSLAFILVTLAATTLPGTSSARVPDDAGRTLLRRATDAWDTGDRVRITSTGPYAAEMTGRFQSLPTDSSLRIRLDHSDAPVDVGLSQIGALSERVGTKRHWRAGAVVGCLVGLAVGALVKDAKDYPSELGNGLRDLYLPFGAAAGALAGAAIGANIRTDRWRVVARFD